MELTDIVDILEDNEVFLEVIVVILLFAILAKVNNINCVIYFSSFLFIISVIMLSSNNVSGYTYDYDSETVYIESDLSDKNFYNCDIINNGTHTLTDSHIDYSNWEVKAQFIINGCFLNDTYVFGNSRLIINDWNIVKNSTIEHNGNFLLSNNYNFMVENSTIEEIQFSPNSDLTDYFYRYNSTIGETTYYALDSDYFETYYNEDTFFNFSQSIDYYLLVNDSHSISYNRTESKLYNISRLFHLNICGLNSTFTNINEIKYNLSVWKDGIEVYNNTIRLNERNNIVISDIIQLDITVKNSIGVTLTNAFVSIQNNDTGNGYFLVTNGANNLINVLSGNLFFHVSFNESNTENRMFELTLNANTIIIIYLNASSTIDYDKELIDYQSEKEGEMWEEIFYGFSGLVILIIVVLFCAYIFWKVIFKDFLNGD